MVCTTAKETKSEFAKIWKATCAQMMKIKLWDKAGKNKIWKATCAQMMKIKLWDKAGKNKDVFFWKIYYYLFK